MHILAGSNKGRSIKTIPTKSYRPTQSKIRKSLFDILGPLEGVTFLDLFAGTGIIGFEAASRGASQVTFVETHSKFIKLLYDNIQNFNDEIFTVIKKSAFSFLGNCGKFDIIFADPPYRSDELSKLVKLSLEQVNDNGYFILESEKGATLPKGSKVRVYGDTQLNIWA